MVRLQNWGVWQMRVKISPKTAVEAEGHQKADGEEGGELDQGLESHGRHHAFVAFRRVEMPGPEHNAERRHDQGHKQAGVQVNRAAEGEAMWLAMIL